MQYLCCCYPPEPCECSNVRFASVEIDVTGFNETTSYHVEREFACLKNPVEFGGIVTSRYTRARVYMLCLPNNDQNYYSSLNIFQAYGFQAPWVDVPGLTFYQFRNESLTDRHTVPRLPHNGDGCDPQYNCCGECSESAGAEGDYVSFYNQYQTAYPAPYDAEDPSLQRMFQATTGVQIGSQIGGQIGPGIVPEPDRFYRYVTVQGSSASIPGAGNTYSYTQDCNGVNTYSDTYSPTFIHNFNVVKWYALNSDDCYTTEVGEPVSTAIDGEWSPYETVTAETEETQWDAQEPPCNSDPCCDEYCDPASTETTSVLVRNRKVAVIDNLQFYNSEPW